MMRPSSRSTRRLRLPLAAAASALLLLSGCAAGQSAETSQPYNPSDGRNVNVPADAGFGDPYMAVRNALVVSDGGAASVTVTLVNNSDEADLLTGITVNGQPAVIVGDQIELPPNERVAIGGGSDRLALVQTPDVQPGNWTELTLTFSRAGTAVVDVVVVATDDEFTVGGESA